MGSNVMWFPTFLKISYFVFHRETKSTSINNKKTKYKCKNDMKVNK